MQITRPEQLDALLPFAVVWSVEEGIPTVHVKDAFGYWTPPRGTRNLDPKRGGPWELLHPGFVLDADGQIVGAES